MNGAFEKPKAEVGWDKFPPAQAIMNFARLASWAHIHISLCEIVALEQQRFVVRGRQRVREAIAIGEPCRMPPPAKPPPSPPRHVSLLGIYRHYFDLCPVQPQIELPASGIAQAASGLSNKMAAIAEVSITITAAAHTRHSR